MQHVLPILEDIRRYLVRKYETMIQQILPQQDEYGKELNRPTDLELRHLQHYLRGQGLFFQEKDDEWFQCALSGTERHFPPERAADRPTGQTVRYSAKNPLKTFVQV